MLKYVMFMLVLHAYLMIMYYTIVKILLSCLVLFLFDQSPSNNKGDMAL